MATPWESGVRVGEATKMLPPAMYLVPVAGPEIEPFELISKPAGLSIGRHGDCDVLLPADADRVSRFHARLEERDGQWSITDLKSRWGTTVNGVRLEADTPTPLSDGDLIRLSPFTFVFSATRRRQGMQATYDAGQTVIRTIGGQGATGVADQMLQLLLAGAEQVHTATDEKTLSQRLMDAALRGSGLSNAVVLRPTDTRGHFEVIASSFTSNPAGAGIQFSQSLIQAASKGEAVELASGDIDDVSHSIVQMGIGSALCVPLMLGASDGAEPTVAAYLYLDSRGMLAPQLRPRAREFCVALGRMASLSLANLKRMEIERRQTRLEADIQSAAKMQEWMLPERVSTIGELSFIGESRFGQAMGGDFFDIIDLGEGKVAVTIGDVSGKGVSASVMMTATHGYLHAALRDAKCPKKAVEAVHHFVTPRRPVGKFVTAWVGVIDTVARTLKFIDAGHGYAIYRGPDGATRVLKEKGGGLPIGMIEDHPTYEAAELAFPPGSALMLMSDGIVEQFGLVTGADGRSTRESFELAGVLKCLEEHVDAPDVVTCLFDALVKHAGSTNLSDDATVVWVQG
jgi:phosphoserine phosphatase RsbU/P